MPSLHGWHVLAQMSCCLFETEQAKVIQDRQIHLPLSSQCLSRTEVPHTPSPAWIFKECSWPCFHHRYINSCSPSCFTGADASRRKQSLQARGLITLIQRSDAVLPGVSHSKYSWFPFVAAPWPLPSTPTAVCVGKHVRKAGSLQMPDGFSYILYVKFYMQSLENEQEVI